MATSNVEAVNNLNSVLLDMISGSETPSPTLTPSLTPSFSYSYPTDPPWTSYPTPTYLSAPNAPQRVEDNRQYWDDLKRKGRNATIAYTTVGILAVFFLFLGCYYLPKNRVYQRTPLQERQQQLRRQAEHRRQQREEQEERQRQQQQQEQQRQRQQEFLQQEEQEFLRLQRQHHQQRHQEPDLQRLGREQQEQQEQVQRRDPDTDINNNQDHTSLASKIVEMNVQELTVLFSEAFEKSKRQTQLQDSQILMGNPQTGVEDDDDDDEEIRRHDNFPSIYLALQSARSSLQPEPANQGKTSDDDADTDDSSVILTEDPSSSGRNSSHIVHPQSLGANRKIVRGNCVICLDAMSAGDIVVWSETKSCLHVYHKKCLVSFLAHNKKQQVQLQRQPEQMKDYNPCPICRRHFVTVCPVVP